MTIKERIEEAGRVYRTDIADFQYEVGTLKEAITVNVCRSQLLDNIKGIV